MSAHSFALQRSNLENLALLAGMFERVERSETVVGGKSSVTTMRRREIRRVVTASEIATRLGPRRDGIAVLLLGLGVGLVGFAAKGLIKFFISGIVE